MPRDEFLGRADERRRWWWMLDESLRAPQQDPRSFVTLIHGIGGMGKSALTKRLVEIADGSVGPPEQAFHSPMRCVLLDMEAERQRLPDRFPPLEGPSLGTLLYIIERAMCEEFGGAAERAFGSFRYALARILHLVDAKEKIQRQGEEGDHSLTPQEIAGLESAVGLVAGLAGVSTELRTGMATVAGGGLAGLYSRWKKKDDEADAGVGQGEIDIALDPERVLLSSFAKGMRQLTSKRSVVVAIDTAEIAERALPKLLEAISNTGGRLVWLIAGRFDTPTAAGYQRSMVAQFERKIRHDRLAVIAISAFDRSLQQAYLESRSETVGELKETDLEKLDLLTRGIPLALQLVVEMLREGVSLENLDRTIDEHGQSSELIKGLTERFLHHAQQLREGVENPLQDDLPAIFGLVVDETAEAGSVIGFDLQRRILSALIDVIPTDLQTRLDQLAERHDFVSASGRVHQEVAEVFSEHLLAADQRFRYASMHERVVAAIRDEMASRYQAWNLEQRLGDDAWRVLAGALIRHEFWISNHRGIAALVNVWPAASVLQSSFASVLRTGTAARRFYPTASSAEQKVLRGLRSSSLVFEQFILKLEGKKGLPAPNADDIRAAERLLRDPPPDDALGTSESIRGSLLELLAAEEEDLHKGADTAFAHMKRADELTGDSESMVNTAIARLARRLSSHFLLQGPQYSLKGARAAAEVAVRRDSDDSESHRYLGIALRGEGELEKSLVEHERTVELEPGRRTSLQALALTQLVRGEHAEALKTMERAVQQTPGDPWLLVSQALVLRLTGQFAEGLSVAKDALRLGRSSMALNAMARALLFLGRYDQALEVSDEAIAAKGDDAGGHGTRGSCLVYLGRFDEALESLDRAVELNEEFGGEWNEKGICLVLAGRYEEAVPALRQATRAAEADPEAWLYLAALGEEEWSAAARALLAPTGLFVHPAKLAEQRALALAATGDLAAAVRELEAQKVPPPHWVYQPRFYELLERRPFDGLEEIRKSMESAHRAAWDGA